MGPELTPVEVSVALAPVRRRARLLEEARRPAPWTEWFWLVLAISVSGYLILSDDLISNSSVGYILLLSAITGFQIRRLQSRVDALTKILTEIGYPGEA